MYMLDTDICSYILKERPIAPLEKFSNTRTSWMTVSIITVAELLYGINRSPNNKINIAVVDKFLSRLKVLDWDRDAANEYASLRVALEKKGKPSGNLDMMIAAHALSVNAILVSNNLQHFAHIPKLKTENWV
jgi:tRNA(fMet)-specific endonuclease VapC